MRNYNQLSQEEKTKAKNINLGGLLEAVIEGAIRFSDEANHDDLQARIDTACEKASKMQTPWFAHEYILDTCRKDLETMVQAEVEDSLYPDSGERIIRL
jgi:cell division protein FtsB